MVEKAQISSTCCAIRSFFGNDGRRNSPVATFGPCCRALHSPRQWMRCRRATRRRRLSTRGPAGFAPGRVDRRADEPLSVVNRHHDGYHWHSFTCQELWVLPLSKCTWPSIRAKYCESTRWCGADRPRGRFLVSIRAFPAPVKCRGVAAADRPREWLEQDLTAAVWNESKDHAGKLEHRELCGISEVHRSCESVLVFHQSNQSVDQVIDVLETARLRSIAIDGDLRASQRLDDEVRNHPSIARVHPWSIGVENARNPNRQSMLSMVIEEQRLGAALSFSSRL